MFKTILASLALALALGGLAQARPFTAKDMAMLDRMSDPRISPDGRLIAYNLRTTDWDGNRGLNALWVMDRTAPSTPPRLIRDQEKGGTAPQWTADGRWLYFLSSRSGSNQVWRVAAGGAEARQMTSLPLDVAMFKLTRDATGLVAAINVHPDCDTLACSKARDEAKAKQKATGTVYDTATPRFWDAYLDGRYLNLFAVKLTGEAPASDATALTRGYQADVVSRPDGDPASFVITPDGARVIFCARPSGSAQGLGDPESLYAVPTDGSAPPRRLDPASTTSDHTLALSPDGARLAYLSQVGSTFTAPRARMMIRDLKTGAARELAPSFDRSPDALAWSADGAELYAVAEDVGQMKIFAVDPASGAVRPLTGEGHVGAIDVAKGIVIYSRDALDSPAQIFELGASGAPKPLSHIAQDALAQTPFSSFEQFSFTGWNGEKAYGYVVKPAGYQPGHKYPVAFLIHGGPHGSFGNAWSYRWNPQVWSAMGYAVVMIDFHGSSGYGETFAKSIVGHWGGPAAGRPAEGLGLRPGQVRLSRWRARLRVGRLLWRLHGRLDRWGLVQTLEVPGGPRRRVRYPADVLLDRHSGVPTSSERRAGLGQARSGGTVQPGRSCGGLGRPDPGRA
jgi:acylaminoacyl-peptidase